MNFTNLGSVLSGINGTTLGALAGAAATSAVAGWLVNGFNGQLQSTLGGVLPHPAATAPVGNAPAAIPTVPVLSAAQVNALSPAGQTAFFQAGGHIVG